MHVAVGVDRAHREHVVGGEPVLEAVHAAGVLGDVAADRADRLARGIGRVEQARGARRPPRPGGCARPAPPWRCARAASSDTIRRIVVITSSTPSLRGMAPPEMPVPAPRVTTGTPRRAARAHDGAHLLLALRQHREHRRLAMRDEGVGLEGLQALVVGDDRERGTDRGERLEGRGCESRARRRAPIRSAAGPDAAARRPSRAWRRTRRSDAAWARPCRD